MLQLYHPTSNAPEGVWIMAMSATIVSVVFAALAALLWAWSSFVNLPVIGSAWGTIANLEPFYVAMKKTARLNSAAAASAFISALTQAIALYAGRS
jgi:hypothetical protein